nr:hypothetical protein C1N82_06655 [Bacillus cereus]
MGTCYIDFSIPNLVLERIYQRFFGYINDFSNISIVSFNISTVRHNISIYQQIPTCFTCEIPHITLYKKDDQSPVVFSYLFRSISYILRNINI